MLKEQISLPARTVTFVPLIMFHAIRNCHQINFTTGIKDEPRIIRARLCRFYKGDSRLKELNEFPREAFPLKYFARRIESNECVGDIRQIRPLVYDYPYSPIFVSFVPFVVNKLKRIAKLIK